MSPATFKKLRNELGFATQLALALKLHISVRSISGYETGEQEIPEKIALAMKGLKLAKEKQT